MEVGVRELKAHLSAYLDRARKGEVVTVTERGRPVARLIAAGEQSPVISAKLAEMLASGKLKWSGKPVALPPRIKLRGTGPTIADMVSENRD